MCGHFRQQQKKTVIIRRVPLQYPYVTLSFAADTCSWNFLLTSISHAANAVFLRSRSLRLDTPKVWDIGGQWDRSWTGINGIERTVEVNKAMNVRCTAQSSAQFDTHGPG